MHSLNENVLDTFRWICVVEFPVFKHFSHPFLSLVRSFYLPFVGYMFVYDRAVSFSLSQEIFTN